MFVLEETPEVDGTALFDYEWGPHRLYGSKVMILLADADVPVPVPIEELQAALQSSLWQEE